MRELDRKLRTDQSPVVDDGDKVAEVDQAISGDIEDAGFWAVSLITREPHAHPGSTGSIAAVRGGLDADILHTTSAELGAAIHFGTGCATSPNAAVVLNTLEFSDVVNAVVGTIVRILEAAGATRIHTFFGNVHAGQPRIPGATKDLKALELLHIISTSQRAQIGIFVAACTSGRGRRTINPSTSLPDVPSATEGFQAFDFVGLDTSPTHVRIFVAARAQCGFHIARNVGTALARVER